MEQQTAVIGNFSITLPAPNGASLQVSGYMYDGESKESLDDRMDVCREALVRQQEILELPVIKREVEVYEKMLADVQKAYADLLGKKAKNEKLSSQDAAAMQNYPVQIKQVEGKLSEALSKIASVKKAA